jgi:hypothetical protein
VRCRSRRNSALPARRTPRCACGTCAASRIGRRAWR